MHNRSQTPSEDKYLQSKEQMRYPQGSSFQESRSTHDSSIFVATHSQSHYDWVFHEVQPVTSPEDGISFSADFSYSAPIPDFPSDVSSESAVVATCPAAAFETTTQTKWEPQCLIVPLMFGIWI